MAYSGSWKGGKSDGNGNGGKQGGGGRRKEEETRADAPTHQKWTSAPSCYITKYPRGKRAEGRVPSSSMGAVG